MERPVSYDREGPASGASWNISVVDFDYVIILDSCKELLFHVTVKGTFIKNKLYFIYLNIVIPSFTSGCYRNRSMLNGFLSLLVSSSRDGAMGEF